MAGLGSQRFFQLPNISLNVSLLECSGEGGGEQRMRVQPPLPHPWQLRTALGGFWKTFHGQLSAPLHTGGCRSKERSQPELCAGKSLGEHSQLPPRALGKAALCLAAPTWLLRKANKACVQRKVGLLRLLGFSPGFLGSKVLQKALCGHWLRFGASHFPAPPVSCPIW